MATMVMKMPSLAADADPTPIATRVGIMLLIFAVSLFSASFPTISRKSRRLSIPAVVFFIGKHFGTGVILSTAFVHLLQDAFECLMDPRVRTRTRIGRWAGLIVLSSLLLIFLVEYISTAYVDRLHSYDSAPPSPKSKPPPTLDADDGDDDESVSSADDDDSGDEDDTAPSERSPLLHPHHHPRTHSPALTDTTITPATITSVPAPFSAPVHPHAPTTLPLDDPSPFFTGHHRHEARAAHADHTAPAGLLPRLALASYTPVDDDGLPSLSPSSRRLVHSTPTTPHVPHAHAPLNAHFVHAMVHPAHPHVHLLPNAHASPPRVADTAVPADDGYGVFAYVHHDHRGHGHAHSHHGHHHGHGHSHIHAHGGNGHSHSHSHSRPHLHSHSHSHSHSHYGHDLSESGISPVGGGQEIGRRRQVVGILVLQLGIMLHSAVIGLTLSIASGADFTSLVTAIGFHQLFEGLSLGVRIAALPRDAGPVLKAALVVLFALTTPLGIAVGLVTLGGADAVTLLLTEGLLSAVSAGMLIYAAAVEMLAADFVLDPSLARAPVRRQALALASLAAGAAAMAVVGIVH